MFVFHTKRLFTRSSYIEEINSRYGNICSILWFGLQLVHVFCLMRFFVHNINFYSSRKREYTNKHGCENMSFGTQSCKITVYNIIIHELLHNSLAIKCLYDFIQDICSILVEQFSFLFPPFIRNKRMCEDC